jgi:hypothetical protein
MKAKSIAIFFVIAGALSIIAQILIYSFNFGLSKIQYFIFPIFLLLFLYLILKEHKRLSLTVFILSLTVFAVGLSSRLITTRDSRIKQAIFIQSSEDMFAVENRKLREQFDRLARNPDIQSLKSSEKIVAYKIDSFSPEHIIITGSLPRLSLSISQTTLTRILGDKLEIYYRKLPLSAITTEINKLTLASSSVKSSSTFLAELSDGLFAENVEEQLLSLAQASRAKAFWGTSDHRAYSLWLLGTLLMKRSGVFSSISTSNNDITRDERAYLKCAAKVFISAGKYLKHSKDNRLKAANTNNYALLRIAEALTYKESSQHKKAKARLNRAYTLLKKAEKTAIKEPDLLQKIIENMILVKHLSEELND